ncbi:MAG: hypothetical protein DME26_08850 [Verrucomicrobia bacterium]|nr:MAG: hypothetical protein DME26_08850 [Verrucomicrobiota bacterium]
MVKRKMAGLIIIPVMVLSLASSRAQEWPVSGLYRITSGGFGAWVEVFGTGFPVALPDTYQSYVELAVDAQRNSVQMTILGEDRHTVPISFGFAFVFTNGVVFPDHVEFASQSPLPQEPSWSYTVSNSAGGLRMDGYFDGAATGLFTRFAHSNIVAVLVAAVPIPTFSAPRGSGSGAIEFTVFNGRPGQTNVIEASTDLARWTAISTNVFPSTVCPICPFIDFQDPASTNLARRYYRSFSLP